MVVGNDFGADGGKFIKEAMKENNAITTLSVFHYFGIFLC